MTIFQSILSCNGIRIDLIKEGLCVKGSKQEVTKVTVAVCKSGGAHDIVAIYFRRIVLAETFSQALSPTRRNSFRKLCGYLVIC